MHESIDARMQKHLDNLTKPKGSLGRLEDYAIRLARIQKRVPPAITRKAVYVFAGDHGIVDEGVSLYPREVTRQMVLNFLGGGAAINALARGCGFDLFAVDAGVAGDFPPGSGLLDRKVGRGTRNFRREPAMSAEELERGLEYGRGLAASAAQAGYELVALGDMGIGNTSSAAAVLAATGFPLEAVVDRGTGIDDQTLARKRRVIEESLAFHSPIGGVKEALRRLGGFELVEMVGFMLGLKDRGLACLLDGFPVSSAAWAACALDPAVKDYLFAGHLSKVRGHAPLLEALGLEPVLKLDMRLGEGTGAVLGGFIVAQAAAAAGEMASFESVGVARSRTDEKAY